MIALRKPHTNTHVLREAVLALQQAGIESASLDARVLLQHALSMTREELLLALESACPARAYALFQRLIARRSAHEPVAYLTGKREFYGLEFAVHPCTLIPRPDSETLIEAAMKTITNRARALQILDVGTGTGCLLLSLLNEYPKAHGQGIDCEPDAVALARANAKHLGLDTRASFLQSNWLESVNGMFDVIVSNPPYIPTADMARLAPDVAEYEPDSALHGGEDGLAAYRVLIPKLKRVLAPQGHVFFEVGIGQAEQVRAFGQDHGLFWHFTHRDLAGIPRVVVFSNQP